jgi:hypothetical protein
MNQAMQGIRATISDEILSSRYRFMVHNTGTILSYFDLGQIKTVAKVLATLEADSFSLPYPFSFADLHLQAYPEISAVYNTLDFAQQCQVLDSAIEYGKKGICKALIAIDYQSGFTTILALGKTQEDLMQRALSYIGDPLVQTLIDESSEKELLELLQNIRPFLQQAEHSDKRYACHSIACSEEFFLSHLFSILLDVPFTVAWGLERDSQGRFIPTYLMGENG